MAAVNALGGQFSSASPDEQTQANQASEGQSAGALGSMPSKLIEQGINTAVKVGEAVATGGASAAAEGAIGAAGAAGDAGAAGGAAAGGAGKLLMGLI